MFVARIGGIIVAIKLIGTRLTDRSEVRYLLMICVCWTGLAVLELSMLGDILLCAWINLFYTD